MGIQRAQPPRMSMLDQMHKQDQLWVRSQEFQGAGHQHPIPNSGIPSSLAQPSACSWDRGPEHLGQLGPLQLLFQSRTLCPFGPCLPAHPEIPLSASSCWESALGLTSTPHALVRECTPTLLGCTARRRFSIHLSLSAADRQEKHLLPEDVVTCGEWQNSVTGEGNTVRLGGAEGLGCLAGFSRQVCPTASERRQNKAH